MHFTLCTPTSLPAPLRVCTTYTIPPFLLLGITVLVVETLHWYFRRNKRLAAARTAERIAARDRLWARRRDAWGNSYEEPEGAGVVYEDDGGWSWEDRGRGGRGGRVRRKVRGTL
ncbi:hypothetical protein MMC11_007707 [Xylographa trunciseda]|nr:hypothetical protein [Xylographa trunciseda]